MADIVERLLSWCIDWNGAPMVDGEQPRIIPRVRDLRDAADEIKRLRAAALAEREMIANTAREWAGHYPQSSDGRNTFILLAEWIENRSAAPKQSGAT